MSGGAEIYTEQPLGSDREGGKNRMKCVAGNCGGSVVQMLIAVGAVITLVLGFGATRPVLAAPARAVADAAQADLSAVARGLPRGGTLRVEDVPIEGTSAALELERFEVFPPDAQVVIATERGDIVVPPPDNAYYRGRVEGDPSAVVVLTARAQGGVRGLIVKNGVSWVIGEESDPHRAPGLSTRQVDMAKEFADHTFHCGTEDLVAPPPSAGDQLGEATADTEPPVAAAAVNYTARVAVDTDYEFYQLFGNETDAIDYVGDLFAYSSTIYETEVNTNLLVSYLKLWTTSADPWTQNSCNGVLSEFMSYWNSNNGGISRTTAHMLSGRNTGCGIAYLGVLCNTSYGYGVSGSLAGNFNIANPGVVWDILVVSHEIGHNFNSPHTHCYNGIAGVASPVDQCYSGESGCYSGLTSLPCSLGPGRGCGTIMSYCHLLSGGYGNITLTFGQGFPYGVLPGRVPTRMHDYVVARAASYPSCLQLVPPPVTGSPTATPTVTSTPTVTATPTPPTLFSAVQDAWIDQSNVTQNKGTDTTLRVQPIAGKLRRTLVQFDLSAVPAGSCVSAATMRLTLTSVQSVSRTYAAHRVTQSWTEGNGHSGVTWKSRDGTQAWTTPGGDFSGTATATTSTGTTNGVALQWDVTADVNAFLAGTAPNYGWLLKDNTEGSGGEFRFASRESGATSQRPRLAITYGPCLPTPSVTPTATPTATVEVGSPTPTFTSGATSTPTTAVTSTPTVTPPVPTPASLVATQDAWIDQRNQNQNKGNDTNMRVLGAAGKARRALVQFDLSSLPGSACVDSARLKLRLTAVQNAPRTFAVHRLTQSWTEGTGGPNTGVTWTRRDAVVGWTVPGGDFVSAATASTSTGTTNDVFLQWDVTPDVAAFIAGTATNDGWLVKDANEGSGNEFRFASRETSTVANRPHLEITFRSCP